MLYKSYCFEVQTPKKFTSVFNGQTEMRMDEEATKLHSYYYYYYSLQWGKLTMMKPFQSFCSILCEEQLEFKRCVPRSDSYKLQHDWETIFLQSSWYV